MKLPAAILALLTGIAGWFYLFHSRSARDLVGVEAEPLNRWRVLLRKMGGGVMLLLAVGLYLGFWAADEQDRPVLFVVVWSVVLFLMAALVLLALVDIKLTVRIRKNQLNRNRGPFLDRSGPS